MSRINIEACNASERDGLSLSLLPFSMCGLSHLFMFDSLGWLVGRLTPSTSSLCFAYQRDRTTTRCKRASDTIEPNETKGFFLVPESTLTRIAESTL